MALDRIGDGLALRSKGDIVSYDGTSAYVLPSSSSGQVIQASSTSPSGVVWATANTAPVEAWVPIGIAQATATTSELTISNIPSGYEKLVAILALRQANNVTYYNFTPSIVINGNTSSNAYNQTYLRYISNNASPDYEWRKSGGDGSMELSYASVASTFGTAIYGITYLEFAGYGQANQDKVGRYIISSWASTGIVRSNLQHGVFSSSTTDAITEIKVLPQSGYLGFSPGSSFDLYGVKNT
jgi:hypothetical protein